MMGRVGWGEGRRLGGWLWALRMRVKGKREGCGIVVLLSQSAPEKGSHHIPPCDSRGSVGVPVV